MSLLSISITLFLIMDSVGNITDFLALIKAIPPNRQRWVILREMLTALAIMVFFYYFGSFLLDSLDVNSSTVQIAGGLVLFLIAIKMIFPEERRMYGAIDKDEPFIVPIATPMTAGPSILATVMFYAYNEATSLRVLMAILAAWALSACVFWFAFEFHRQISPKVLNALERLMGLVLTLMAVEMFLKGLRFFILNQGQ
jgi:multiple antibiotic resistance protein